MHANNRRLLIVDDNSSIHEDFRKILGNGNSAVSALNHVETELFGESSAGTNSAEFEIDSAYQGQEGLTLVQQALEHGCPYAIAFVDVRMPPGWDGIETTNQLWRVDPGLQIVICTAYSDYSWQEMSERLGTSNRLLILKKPFDSIEVLQLANTLTEKWHLSQQSRSRTDDLERRVEARTQELKAANEKLQKEVLEREQTEAALRNSEERYRLLFQHNPHPMWIYDLETLAVLTANNAAVHQYGYSREEFLAMNIGDIWGRDDSGVLDQISKGKSESGAPFVWKHCKKDGTLIDVEISAHDLNLDGRPARLILAQDITERKQLELQLRHSQKMEAVGCLAGGVAHDFNNLLTVIIGNSELLMEQFKNDKVADHDLQAIRQAGQQAATLTRQLLAFSRKQVLQPEVLDLNTAIADHTKILRRLIGEDIELVMKVEPDLRSIKADPGQLEQVLMNLAVNARDAMPIGGKLTIRAANIFLDRRYALKQLPVQPGWYVMLAVSDTGCGMNAETQSRIFEPFFTTKEQGKGTGLGLSTVYGIIKQSGGQIRVHSEPGRGSTFTIFLPCAEEGASLSLAKHEEVRPQGSETIMVVEDEADVRKLSCRILLKNGYHVLEATSSQQALALGRHYQKPIHLLLTDVVMPHMSGADLTRRMASSHPEMKILYMSGYTNDAVIRHGISEAEVDFLQKPFSPCALTQKVREVLDGSA
jgi:hypothetical protein